MKNGRSCDGQRKSGINRGERIGRVESRTTVERTEASRNERAGWAARTPDIESAERNAKIGINGDAEGNPGCAGKDEAEKQGGEAEQETETVTRRRRRRKRERRPRIQRGAINPENRATDDYGDPVMKT